jgi:hypothetical protein
MSDSPNSSIENYPEIERVIECVDCGGAAHLINEPPADDLYPSDILVYRCADCLDRWDIVYDPDGELAEDF